MARATFTILCSLQMLLGLLMFSFGIVDRAAIELQCSFLMLPIWIGVLAGLIGFYSLIIGRQNKRQGFADIDAGSVIKVINIICVGLSFLALFMYGSALSYIGLREVYNVRQEWSNVTPVPLPNLPSGIWYKDSDTIQGIFAVVVILCFAEMFVGCWMAIIDRQQMIFGTPNQEGRIPLISNEAGQPSYYQQPAQQRQQTGIHFVQVPVNNQLPQQQVQVMNPQMVQPVGCAVVPGNTNFASNQAFVPSNQVQQPQYVQQNMAPQQTPVVMLVPSNQNMVPNNQNVFSNQNMVPSNQNVFSNQNMVSSNQNMMPGNRLPGNQTMAPGNQNMVPGNQRTVPSNQNPGIPSVQSEEAEGASTDSDQRFVQSQQNEWIKMDSDKNKLI